MTIISMEFVSATVKRDKVLRMIEKGTIKELLKKKEGPEETQKHQQNGAQKEAEEDNERKESKDPKVVFI